MVEVVVYGNTYHSVSIEVNGKRVADLPRAYGYGEQYLWRAWEWLMDNNYVYPERYSNGSLESPWAYAEKHGIRLNYYAHDVGRQRDL